MFPFYPFSADQWYVWKTVTIYQYHLKDEFENVVPSAIE